MKDRKNSEIVSEIQDIEDRQNDAYERRERNIIKLRKAEELRKKNWEKKWGVKWDENWKENWEAKTGKKWGEDFIDKNSGENSI